MARLSYLLTFVSVCVGMTAASPLPLGDQPSSLGKRTWHTGRGTWFEVGLGACGYTDVDSSPVVAISSAIYNSGGNCNQWLYIVNNANGQTAYGQVRDECPGCDADSIDMSPSLFSQLGDLATGVLDVSWHFKNIDFTPSS